LDGLTISQIMMGTDANTDNRNTTNVLTDEAKSPSANDKIIVVDSEKENIREEVMPAIDEFLDDLSPKRTSEEAQAATSWSEAFDLLPEANVAQFSIP
ncbi:acyl-CoA synthetase FdrA, partial [Enterococcus faecalis]